MSAYQRKFVVDDNLLGKLQVPALISKEIKISVKKH
jgi:hypothetical protein